MAVKTAPDWLTAQPFAHRGLHLAGRGVPENSLAAFRLAIAKNVGIELDVRLSLDGIAMVFHDEDLSRLTEGTGDLSQTTARRLESLRLKGSTETVPTLHSVMSEVAGRVPVLIEMKVEPKTRRNLCAAVRRSLEGYRGPAGVMSFDPDAVRWFAKGAPQLARGLVVTTESQNKHGWVARTPAAQRMLARRARAQFIAYDLASLPNRFVKWARASGYPVLTWTVRKEDEAEKAYSLTDNIIFELEEPYEFAAAS